PRYLNTKSFTVIGVMVRDFAGLDNFLNTNAPELWLPLTMRPQMLSVHYEETAPENRDWFGGRGFQWLDVCGRLKPGRALEEGQAEVAGLLGQESPGVPGDRSKKSHQSLPCLAVQTRILQINDVDGLGRYWPRVADCLRQYRQSSAGAGGRAAERVRFAALPRRDPLAADSAVVDRKSAARGL